MPIPDEVHITVWKHLLHKITCLNAQTAALTKLLRAKGVSVAELDAAMEWAEGMLADARAAVDSIPSEPTHEDFELILRRFQGPVQ